MDQLAWVFKAEPGCIHYVGHTLHGRPQTIRQQMRRALGRDGGVHETDPEDLPREVEHRGARTRAEHQRGRARGIERVVAPALFQGAVARGRGFSADR